MVRSQRELQAKAARDPLTGCLNRETILAALQELLDQQAPWPRGAAVIFIDLDDFKQINDSQGHAAGDKVLIEVAENLHAATRSGDLLARFGGDEFVVVCANVLRDEALAAARSIQRRAFGAASVRASLGVAWTDLPGQSATALVHAADEAMYEAKRTGRAEPVMAGAVRG